MKITKIVLTGGPGGGKSTCLPYIAESISKLGYKCITIPETATILLKKGINRFTAGSVINFQRLVLKNQLEAEEKALKEAVSSNAEKVLIICDRGVMDGKVYLPEGAFDALAAEIGTNAVELRDRYDAVFHMESAAKHFPENYIKDSNDVREEDAPLAAKVDDDTVSVWVGHPHMRIIGGAGDFEKKMETLAEEIKFFLGEPEPLEIERKFLIEYPDVKLLRSLPNCGLAEITQVYLTRQDGENRRIRKRGIGGSCTYFYTRKKKIDDLTRIEIEEKITAEQYKELEKEADPDRTPISKDRYCLLENGFYFEIDVYPFWTDRATLEVELRYEDQKFDLPKEVTVIRDVSGEKRYTNSELAKNHGRFDKD